MNSTIKSELAVFGASAATIAVTAVMAQWMWMNLTENEYMAVTLGLCAIGYLVAQEI